MSLRVGDWVEVCSKEEILATLDSKGRLDGMPFMPGMFKYCGQRFQVYKSAHKTCDPIFTGQSRGVASAVHLSLRCDGAAFGGCQAGCLLFWKDAWLKPDGSGASAGAGHSASPRCTEEDVHRATRADDPDVGDEPRYACQTTQLLGYTTPLNRRDPRQYIQDLTSGNASVGELMRGSLYSGLVRRFESRISLLRNVYDLAESAAGNNPLPKIRGSVPDGQQAPTIDLGLQPGELVRIRSLAEIEETINSKQRNRGLLFDMEMVPFCGGTYRVRTRVERFLDERTGRIKALKTPAIILEDVWCKSKYSFCKMHCPRSLYTWWREIWLERVAEAVGEVDAAGSMPAGHVTSGQRV